MALLSIVVLLSIPFIVGDQPQGAESLNPVDRLETVAINGDATKQAILLFMYGTFAVLLLTRERLRTLQFLGTPLILLLGWTFASAMWSVQPDVTLRRAVALSGSVGFALYLGLRFDLRQMLALLSWAAFAVLVASLTLAIIDPNLGLDFEGRLRGVTAHKNAIASFAALAFLVSLEGLRFHRESRLAFVRTVAVIVVSLACMGLARSTAVLPVLATAFAALAFGGFLRRASAEHFALLPLGACVGVLLAALAVGHSGEIAELLGKDPNISGRTLVWDFVRKMILAEPLIGYGYGAFWNGGNSPGAVFWSNTHLGVPHAHNGYLQLLLEEGFTALILILLAAATLVVRLTKLMRSTRQYVTAWPLGFLAFYLAANLSETWLWIGNELMPIVFVYLVVRTNLTYLALSRSRWPTGLGELA
jgi:O-antigen ligase